MINYFLLLQNKKSAEKKNLNCILMGFKIVCCGGKGKMKISEDNLNELLL